jgi:hypothetical protein
MRILLSSVALIGVVGWTASAEPVSYTQDVLPILASKCYPCHGPDEAERKGGLRLDLRDALFAELPSGAHAVDQEQPEKSALLYRVTTDDADDRMPPASFPKPLTADEVVTLRAWVEQGAPWEEHWAFAPVIKPTPPKVGKTNWVRNDIDRFIAATHATQGLRPSFEADKRTLIRRLTFDLHGLPPTPEEIAAFLADESPEAYDRLVDRLLASPRYGERWARHWLDVAHYGETHGYDKDKRRPNAWPYRDYVIDALNTDKPYGRFVEEQLAGDVLYPDDPQATVATGFIAAGPWDFVGHVELREGTVDKKITRSLDRDDMVASTMATFTSLTVHCARCHDHKFDPIVQEDYYSLQAVFAGVDRADRTYDDDPVVHRERQGLLHKRSGLIGQQRALHGKMAAATNPEIQAVIEQRDALYEKVAELKAVESPGNGYHSAIESSPNAIKWVQVDLGSEQAIDNVRFYSPRPTDYPDTPGFGFPLRFKIEASATPDFAEPTILVDHTQANHTLRTDAPFIVATDGIRARYVRVTATRLWERQNDFVFALAELEVLKSGQNLARGVGVNALDSIDAGRWHTQYLVDGFDSRRRIGEFTDTDPAGITLEAARAEVKTFEAKEARLRRESLSATEQKTLTDVERGIAGMDTALSLLPEPKHVYAATADYTGSGNFRPPGVIRAVHLLNRGDVKQPGEAAVSGAVSFIPTMPGRFELSAGHTEGERRAALAKWIADSGNPLTWRSIVNRIWHYHFGAGLVPTPNDFGRMGTPPTHPELLDWLAASFLEQGQSLKQLHKAIVSSATYRQVSTHDADNAAIDGSNRYMWRMNRRQLEAEAVRDSVLAVSGKLDLTMGGPGFDLFRYEDDHSPRYLYQEHDPSDAGSFRRSIYRFVVRSVPDPFMTAMDCADPSQSVPVRSETVTALQALAVFNNPLVIQQADYFAERLRAETSTREAQIGRAYALSLGREASNTEAEIMLGYEAAHGLSAMCRLLLNTSEFLYVD